MKAAYKIFLGAALLAILLVSIVDVGGRYLFNAPLIGSDDLIRFGMAIVVFAALPSVCNAGEHITVDLISSRLPAIARGFIERTFRALAALTLFFIAWRLYELGLIARSSGDRSPIFLLPYPPLISFMSFCAAIAGVIEAIRIIYPAERRPPANLSPREE